jgi:uncharacterized protein YprB with RNaseH-like and TPR domain
MQPYIEAYRDIATTGLSPRYSVITVGGINREYLGSLKGVDVVYAYDGGSFNLPVIHRLVAVGLAELFKNYDLM